MSWAVRGVSGVLCAVALVACGDAGDPDDYSRIGEEAKCPDGTVVEGVDVSKYQATINWSSVATSNVQFAIMRVSYGTSKDTYFDQNWSGSKSAGLIRGLYQYFLAGQDAIAQADLVVDAMGGTVGPGDLPPVLDVEGTGNTGVSQTTWRSQIALWIARIEARLGVTPIIYSGCYFWPDNVGSTTWANYPLWVPNYGVSCTCLPSGYWDKWLIWQYTDSGTVPGIPGNVDRDRFNGTLAQLQALTGGGTTPTAYYDATFVSQSFPYTSVGPAQVPAGGTLPASITLRNTGTAPWDANTHLATSEPRDRASPFAGAEWPAPNRYARVSGAVAPGATYTFSFDLHAPQTLGVYDEHFGLVQEGVAWFSDPGQGGPPDDQLEGLFEVVAGSAGGTAGTGGTGGTGGTSTTGGSAGTGGSPGTGGTSTTGGSAGTAGTSGGSAGAGGSAGTGGAAGASGTGATAGVGTTTGGAAGTSTGAAGAESVPPYSGSEGGCGCRVAASRPRSAWLAGLALGAALVRRRRRRGPSPDR